MHKTAIYFVYMYMKWRHAENTEHSKHRERWCYLSSTSPIRVSNPGIPEAWKHAQPEHF